MHFANFIIALGSIATVAGEFRDINDRNVINGNTYNSVGSQVARGVPSTDSFVQERDSHAKTKGNTKSNTKGNTKSTTKGTTCKGKRSSRFAPRYLFDEPKQKECGKFELYENEWTNCLLAKKGDQIEVTDVSACSAVFIWNSQNVPSVFHIFCNHEDPNPDPKASKGKEGDAVKAARIAGDTDCMPAHITIAANSPERYNKIRGLLKQAIKDREDLDLNEETDFTPMTYRSTDLPEGKRYKFTAIAGTRQVTRTEVDQADVSRQRQRQG